MKCSVIPILAAVFFTVPAMAQPTAPKIIKGYKCMMLNITELQSMDPNFHVFVRSAPSASAPVAGWATSVVIVPNDVVSQNGFVPMLRANGQKAWISETDIKPYRPVAAPNAHCVPQILPNGRVGIGPG